jgi:hypothetical protein
VIVPLALGCAVPSSQPLPILAGSDARINHSRNLSISLFRSANRRIEDQIL